MPLPRKKDAGSSGAPILDILNAHVRLFDVEEYIEPRTIERKSDGRTFTFDPAFNCSVEVINDGVDGADNGTRFYESFRYKQDKDGKWFNQQNSKLGALTEVVKPGYFDNDTIPELDASDLEGFEMFCRVKPSKNPAGVVVGSTVEWDTVRRVSTPEKVAAVAAEAEEDFDDIPF